MAGPFYARYNPAKPPASSVSQTQPDGTQNTGETTVTTAKKRKKHQKGDGHSKRARHESEREVEPGTGDARVYLPFTQREGPAKTHKEPNHGDEKQRRRDANRENDLKSHNQDPAAAIQNGQEATSAEAKQTEHSRQSNKSSIGETTSAEQHLENREAVMERKRKKKSKPATHTPDEHTSNDANDSTKRHSSIMSKYAKAMTVKNTDAAKASEDARPSSEEPEINSLEPLPVPQRVGGSDSVISFSHLPSWLSKPIVAKDGATLSFAELSVSGRLVASLKKKGLSSALPIQTGVLPLLLPTPRQHPGDVCVSAATGSGKTLAYVLPIVQSLEMRQSKRLKAVIVVPTRELVNQVREVTGLCLANTALKLGTAVGATPLKTEQDLLIRKSTRFDPEKYRRLQQRAQERLARGTESTDSDTDESDAEELDKLHQHVVDYVSQVDILVCTPGRLVDHVKSTKGFSLAELEWLVIDEADRLLDQSFQEWTGIILDAVNKRNLKHQRSPFPGDALLSAALDTGPPRPVRKVILSATMTKDLDKLSSLKLRNPKLVLLDGMQVGSGDGDGDGAPVDSSGRFQLPRGLEEFVVPVEDGADKPLYLLQLLRTILTLSEAAESGAAEDDVDSDSSASSDSSGSGSSSADSVASWDDSSDAASSSSSASTSGSDDISPPPPARTPSALIFTSSNESAVRLSHVLTHLLTSSSPSGSAAPAIHTLTKSSTRAATQAVLASFAASHSPAGRTAGHQQKRPVLVIATDRASRGLDLPALPAVVNYDVPRSVTAYVHRVGRTARAGAKGRAYTLLERREAAWFWNCVARGDGAGRGASAGSGPGPGHGAGKGEGEGVGVGVGNGVGKGEGSAGEGTGIARAPGSAVQRLRLRVGDGDLGAGVRARYAAALARLRSDVEGRAGAAR